MYCTWDTLSDHTLVSMHIHFGRPAARCRGCSIVDSLLAHKDLRTEITDAWSVYDMLTIQLGHFLADALTVSAEIC